jgi:hypothetical protein
VSIFLIYFLCSERLAQAADDEELDDDALLAELGEMVI